MVVVYVEGVETPSFNFVMQQFISESITVTSLGIVVWLGGGSAGLTHTPLS